MSQQWLRFETIFYCQEEETGINWRFETIFYCQEEETGMKWRFFLYNNEISKRYHVQYNFNLVHWLCSILYALEFKTKESKCSVIITEYETIAKQSKHQEMEEVWGTGRGGGDIHLIQTEKYNQKNTGNPNGPWYHASEKEQK